MCARDAKRAMSAPQRLEYFYAPCPQGLEGVLAIELEKLGASKVESSGAGCKFRALLADAWRITYLTRIATRILWQQAEGPYQSADDVYIMAKAVPWEERFAHTQSFKVDAAVHRSPLKSVNYAVLRVKDGLADRFRDKRGTRPHVNVREPDVYVFAFLSESRVTLYLDLAGEPLFKRGAREHRGDAPLKRNLAAGILAMTEWQPGRVLLDPMCGAGTFLLEAADIALRRPAGAGRAFAFERLSGFDAKRFDEMKSGEASSEQPLESIKGTLFASDNDPRAVRYATQNIADAGLSNAIEVTTANVLERAAPAPQGTLVTNPPYGERLSETSELAAFYPELGHALKRNFAGWTAYVLTADRSIEKLMRLAPSRKTPLFNGALECRLYRYELVAGSHRKKAPGDSA